MREKILRESENIERERERNNNKKKIVRQRNAMLSIEIANLMKTRGLQKLSFSQLVDKMAVDKRAVKEMAWRHVIYRHGTCFRQICF